MIHYHGTPITPNKAAISVLAARHAMVSFAHPEQIALVAEVCQTFALDNGAYTFWKHGEIGDWQAYSDWVDLWGQHPAFDFAIIPDVVDGLEKENDLLIDQWFSKARRYISVPVWHLHESLKRLEQLSWNYPWRVALGSSGEFSTVGNPIWWNRMGEAMEVLCNSNGVPRCKLHGLRMMNPTVFSHLPLASADSTNIARNINLDNNWKHAYAALSESARAMVIADRIESHASASRWTGTRGLAQNMELFG